MRGSRQAGAGGVRSDHAPSACCDPYPASCQHLTPVALQATVEILIKSFKHDGLEKFFKQGSKAGIQPAHARKLQLQLAALNAATQASDMNAPGWDLHPLKGRLVHHFSISVNGNWRLTFRFNGQDATVVDYLDYH